jgi:hypothetical protein
MSIFLVRIKKIFKCINTYIFNDFLELEVLYPSNDY